MSRHFFHVHEQAQSLKRLLILGAFFALGGQTVHAQIISPGKLSTAHADLEGITRCTNCHSLGKRGVDATRCLDCHTPLKTRIDAGKGYHGTREPGTCGTCHKEHFGRDFDAVRLDTLKFDHDETGFELLASHEKVSCGSCHVPDNIVDNEVLRFKGTHGAVDGTYLGLAVSCRVCHGSDSPHEMQFGNEECSTCHDEGVWDEAPRFDHAETEFALTGRHVDVACADCHEPQPKRDGSSLIVYSDAEFASCTSCHEDNHDGTMGATCTTCHSTSGWDRVAQNTVAAAFDHDRTGFSLVGRHDAIACSSCHAKRAPRTETIRIQYTAATRGKTFPHPAVQDCASCHVDYHDGFFAATGQLSCDNCHTEQGWLPSGYDVNRHNRESEFVLTGSHLATPCFACHNNTDLGQDRYTFEFADTSCETCHEPDSPHEDEFAGADGKTECSTCHATDAWPTITSFDHDLTEFPLTGRHVAATCISCHGDPEAPEIPLTYAQTSPVCSSCHASDDPHRDQFEDPTCDSCHDTASFRLSLASTSFNHESTRFPLDGAHEDVVCGACHAKEEAPDGRYFTRFRPLPMECRDCHADSR